MKIETVKKFLRLFFFLGLLAGFLLGAAVFAQVGALPYHYKLTTRTGTGGAGNDYVLTFEVHDANHVLKGTDTCNYASAATAHDIKECIAAKIKLRAATDAGGTAALITAMLGVDNDMDAAPAAAASVPDATTLVKGISILATDNEATVSKPMKSDDPRGSNDRTANNLRSATTVIGISAALAPVAGQVIKAINSTSASWQDDATGSGSDPWTIVRLTADFLTSSATAVDVTGMAFTPAANTRYEISGIFLLRTATTTVGPRTGVAWPTGMTDGVVVLTVESAVGTQVMAQGNSNAAVLAPVGGLPTNTQSYPGELNGMLLAGATPSGTFKIQLASETAGTNVTMKAGSFIRYRIIP